MKKKEIKSSVVRKCALCGAPLRYNFELESGVCENCQLGRKVKTFEQFNLQNNKRK